MSPRIAPWQVWWADLDPVTGREQAGHRPVLVISSPFHLRLTGGEVVTVVPLTTRHRPYLLHRLEIAIPGRRPGYAITEQMRTISTRRLTGDRPLWRLPPERVAECRDILRRMIDL